MIDVPNGFLAGTVVLGNLAIILPHPVFEDNYTAAEINSFRFPLREITGYFAVVHAGKVDSLGDLFPELAGKYVEPSLSQPQHFVAGSLRFV